MRVKLALVQKAPVLSDKDANLKMMEKEVKKASKAGADIVIFGELFLTGYRIKDRVARLAETADGDSIKRMLKVAKGTGCNILFGMPERDTEVRGLIYNSAVLAKPDGKVDIYRKWFLPTFGPFEEKIHFTPGKGVRVFETEKCKLGTIICYDMFFPELSKALTLQGAEILVNLSAAPSSTGHFFQMLARARAIENAIPFVYCNLVGVEEGLKFYGGTIVYGPRGNTVAEAKLYEEEVLLVDIDLSEIDFARFHRATIRDTRKELFKHIHDNL